MSIPAGWQNPSQVRLDIQQGLLDAGTQRSTPIRVTPDGVIWDGHRLAAEQGTKIAVQVVKFKLTPTAASILDLPVG